jgi:hypothetical protein
VIDVHKFDEAITACLKQANIEDGLYVTVVWVPDGSMAYVTSNAMHTNVIQAMLEGAIDVVGRGDAKGSILETMGSA